MPSAKVKNRRDFQPLLAAAFIIAATFLVYLPAIRGGFIWDDPQHITQNSTLRSSHGLWQMWRHPTSLPQWYPLVHTTFWIEYRLWGVEPLGYHITNVLLHITASLLLWRVLKVLEVPAAWLAAAMWALHPVQAESVAWITERKNVLSMVFYLLALLTYLQFHDREQRSASDAPPRMPPTQPPDPRQRDTLHRSAAVWCASFLLFALALFSKTVTATLPAAILVILWWKRGTLRWRDVLPLLPFFAIGVGMGVTTAYLEAHHVGAASNITFELNLSPADRVLIAGQAVTFYARKVLVPWPLAFIYPRWNIDPAVWWQWLFPLAVAAVIALLILNRKRLGRGPAAAVMIFSGTLFPALGFINVYPMRFSFVADHFQYHASAAMLALFAALLCRAVRNYGVVALVPLILLTVMRTPDYATAETLWQDTLTKNPNSWMVHINLAHVLREKADATGDQRLFAQAEQHYLQALQIEPEIPETRLNAGIVYARRNEYDKAMEHLNRAMEMVPQYPPIYLTIGQVYDRQGDLNRAADFYGSALKLDPTYADANSRLAGVLEKQDQFAEAAAHYRLAAGAMPDDFAVRFSLGSVLVRLGQYDEAIFNLKHAVELQPQNARTWLLLGLAQMKAGHQDEAIQSAQRARELDPNLSPPNR